MALSVSLPPPHQFPLKKRLALRNEIGDDKELLKSPDDNLFKIAPFVDHPGPNFFCTCKEARGVTLSKMNLNGSKPLKNIFYHVDIRRVVDLNLSCCDLSNLTDDYIPNSLPDTLKDLDLSEAKNIPTTLIIRALNAKNIEKLNLGNCDLSNLREEDIPESLPGTLKDLDLSKAKNIPTTLIIRALNAKNIKKLNLGDCNLSKLKENDIPYPLADTLKTLTLTMSNPTSYYAKNIPQQLIKSALVSKNLAELNLGSCDLINLREEDIPEFLPDTLKTLTLYYPCAKNIPKKLIKTALVSKNLEELNLGGCDLINLTEEDIPESLPDTLKTLTLDCAKNIPKKLIKTALVSKNLAELNLGSCDLINLTEEDIPEFLPDTLKTLAIFYAKKIPQQLIKSALVSKNLAELNLGGCDLINLTEEDIPESLPDTLKKLVMHYAKNIPQKLIKTALVSKNLAELNLAGCDSLNLREEDIPESLPDTLKILILENIEKDNAPLSKFFISALASKNLAELNLGGCDLSNLREEDIPKSLPDTLKILIFTNIEKDNAPPSKFFSSALASKNLAELNLEGCDLSNLREDDIPESLPDTLKILDLSKAKKIPLKLITSALVSKGIKQLDLEGCDLSVLTNNNPMLAKDYYIPILFSDTLEQLYLNEATNIPFKLILMAKEKNKLQIHTR